MAENFKTKDYSYLEGKEVEWFYSTTPEDLGSDFIGIVKGCDYEVGVTIVNKEDKEHYLTCYPGPTGEKVSSLLCHPEWDLLFPTIIAMLESGYYHAPDESSLFGNGPTSSSCAFGQ